MKKILTMVLVALMLVLVFAGCGGEEMSEPEVPTETQVPGEEPEEEENDPAEIPSTNAAVFWSADEWVINGISVFSGSESIDAIAAILGAEPRYPGGIIFEGGYTGTSIDATAITKYDRIGGVS